MHRELVPAANRRSVTKCHNVHLELSKLMNMKRNPSISAPAVFASSETKRMNLRETFPVSGKTAFMHSCLLPPLPQ